MNNPRPYGDDPQRGDSYGRHSAPQGPPQQRPAPSPQGSGGGYPAPNSGWRPAPDPQAPPAGYPRQSTDGAPGYKAPGNSDWDYEEDTRMIGKLGYVPPEVKHGRAPEDFDATSVSASDRVKFRTRKRARKASMPFKAGIIGGIVLVLALIGGGVWLLSGDEPESTTSELTYQVLEKPCGPMDTSAMDDLSTQTEPLAEETETIGSKTTQKCAVRVGDEPGTGADVEVTTVVFTRDAGARNEFEHVSGQSAEIEGFAKLKDVADGAFVVSRPWSDDTGTADYSLHLFDGNAYLYARVVVYTELSEDDIAARAKTIAESYLANW